MRKLVKSFQYALEGIVYTLATQRNMRIHFAVSLFVMLVSLLLGIKRSEALLLFVAITFVIITELFNTAVEAVVDMMTTTFHPKAKVAKDVAAGAVFLAAGLAIAVGLTVFAPYILALFQHVGVDELRNPDVSVAVILGLVLFGTIFFKGVSHYRKWPVTPSLLISLAVSIVLVVWWLTFHLVVALLVTILCLLLIGNWLLQKQEIRSFVWGAITGGVITLISFWFI